MPEEKIPELQDAFSEENLRDLGEFLAVEGMAPLEADYVPEPSPVPEGRPIAREGGEQAERPAEKVAPEVSGCEVEKTISGEIEDEAHTRRTITAKYAPENLAKNPVVECEARMKFQR